jgi:K+-sensing histidine kinase KdpD
MGMGLAICRSIIEDLNGDLSIARNRSQGATIRFALPVSNEDSQGLQKIAMLG